MRKKLVKTRNKKRQKFVVKCKNWEMCTETHTITLILCIHCAVLWLFCNVSENILATDFCQCREIKLIRQTPE